MTAAAADRLSEIINRLQRLDAALGKPRNCTTGYACGSTKRHRPAASAAAG